MTRYSETDRAHAIGLAIAKGPRDASIATRIPRRTISRWLADPDVRATIAANTETLAAELLQAATLGARELTRRITDPKARLGDIARATEVALQQHALLTGGVTARTEETKSLTADLPEHERRALRDAIEREMERRRSGEVVEVLSPDEQRDLRDFLDYVERLSDDELRSSIRTDPSIVRRLTDPMIVRRLTEGEPE